MPVVPSTARAPWWDPGAAAAATMTFVMLAMSPGAVSVARAQSPPCEVWAAAVARAAAELEHHRAMIRRKWWGCSLCRRRRRERLSLRLRYVEPYCVMCRRERRRHLLYRRIQREYQRLRCRRPGYHRLVLLCRRVGDGSGAGPLPAGEWHRRPFQRNTRHGPIKDVSGADSTGSGLHYFLTVGAD